MITPCLVCSASFQNADLKEASASERLLPASFCCLTIGVGERRLFDERRT